MLFRSPSLFPEPRSTCTKARNRDVRLAITVGTTPVFRSLSPNDLEVSGEAPSCHQSVHFTPRQLPKTQIEATERFRFTREFAARDCLPLYIDSVCPLSPHAARDLVGYHCDDHEGLSSGKVRKSYWVGVDTGTRCHNILECHRDFFFFSARKIFTRPNLGGPAKHGKA